jgi:hypothetical protein
MYNILVQNIIVTILFYFDGGLSHYGIFMAQWSCENQWNGKLGDFFLSFGGVCVCVCVRGGEP